MNAIKITLDIFMSLIILAIALLLGYVLISSLINHPQSWTAMLTWRAIPSFVFMGLALACVITGARKVDVWVVPWWVILGMTFVFQFLMIWTAAKFIPEAS